MKKTIILTMLICVILALVGCNEVVQERPQHPTTVKQMEQITEWSKNLDNRFKAIDNNLLYLWKRIEDPNDPNSLTLRVNILEENSIVLKERIGSNAWEVVDDSTANTEKGSVK